MVDRVSPARRSTTSATFGFSRRLFDPASLLLARPNDIVAIAALAYSTEERVGVWRRGNELGLELGLEAGKAGAGAGARGGCILLMKRMAVSYDHGPSGGEGEGGR